MNSSEEISYWLNDVKKKAFLLILVSFISAIAYWKIITINLVGDEILNGAGIPSIISPFLFYIFYQLSEKKLKYTNCIGILMAISLGVFFGSISGFFERNTDGLIIQAVSTTFGSVLLLIFLYKNKFIIVNNKFLNFTAFVFSSLSWILSFDVIMSFVDLNWRSLFMGVSAVAIGLNVGILLQAYLVFTIDLNIIDLKIQKDSISKRDSWKFAIELLVDLAWVYFALIFLMLRIRGRSKN